MILISSNSWSQLETRPTLNLSLLLYEIVVFGIFQADNQGSKKSLGLAGMES